MQICWHRVDESVGKWLKHKLIFQLKVQIIEPYMNLVNPFDLYDFQANDALHSTYSLYQQGYLYPTCKHIDEALNLLDE